MSLGSTTIACAGMHLSQGQWGLQSAWCGSHAARHHCNTGSLLGASVPNTSQQQLAAATAPAAAVLCCAAQVSTLVFHPFAPLTKTVFPSLLRVCCVPAGGASSRLRRSERGATSSLGPPTGGGSAPRGTPPTPRRTQPGGQRGQEGLQQPDGRRLAPLKAAARVVVRDCLFFVSAETAPPARRGAARMNGHTHPTLHSRQSHHSRSSCSSLFLQGSRRPQEEQRRGGDSVVSLRRRPRWVNRTRTRGGGGGIVGGVATSSHSAAAGQQEQEQQDQRKLLLSVPLLAAMIPTYRYYY